MDKWSWFQIILTIIAIVAFIIFAFSPSFKAWGEQCIVDIKVKDAIALICIYCYIRWCWS